MKSLILLLLICSSLGYSQTNDQSIDYKDLSSDEYTYKRYLQNSYNNNSYTPIEESKDEIVPINTDRIIESATVPESPYRVKQRPYKEYMSDENEYVIPGHNMDEINRKVTEKNITRAVTVILFILAFVFMYFVLFRKNKHTIDDNAYASEYVGYNSGNVHQDDVDKNSKVTQLQKWHDLLKMGAITEEEYQTQKKKILDE